MAFEGGRRMMLDLYESPFSFVLKRLGEEAAKKADEAIMEAVFKADIQVDKEELVKALLYDRDQYNKGVADGKLLISLDFARFYNLRERLFKAIKEVEEYGKSYEGTFCITMEMPDYYDDPEALTEAFAWNIHLDCYLVGPYRHYDWRGKTLAEALDKCEEDILSWIDKEVEEDG